ncbi:GNAT family N-acetyltransferase [Paenibacillus alkalitolerans]|uniref:GNAT family N-acetyltransferase n=1 Tax=Paenibacillus alkalitolerans TaxID=2799335 RepID=UPI0018F3DDF1|nr:GNAT family N-acetyltransferase [Paenibacillus alkalitolerans]
MLIREACIDDVEGIAFVHLESWKSTYKELISDSYLSNITLEKRIRNWIWTFNNLNQDETIFVAEDSNKGVIGFSNVGKNRNSEFEHDGELYSLYLLKDYHGQGIGQLLFDRAVVSLKGKGCRSLMLWVLEGNPTLGFYIKNGGEIVGRKNVLIGDDNLVEIAIGWKDISNFCEYFKEVGGIR